MFSTFPFILLATVISMSVNPLIYGSSVAFYDSFFIISALWFIFELIETAYDSWNKG